MKLLKLLAVIVGVTFIIFSIPTLIEMWSQEHGAGFLGVLTGFFIVWIISMGLIYFGTRKKNEVKDSKIKLHDKTRGEKIQNHYSKNFNDQKEQLENLKNKGLISSKEYEGKLKGIAEKEFKETIEGSQEYIQLKALFNSGVFTEEEFILKKKNLLEQEKQRVILKRKREDEILSRISSITLVKKRWDIEFGRYEEYIVGLVDEQSVKMWRTVSQDLYLCRNKRTMWKFKNKEQCLKFIVENTEDLSILHEYGVLKK